MNPIETSPTTDGLAEPARDSLHEAKDFAQQKLEQARQQAGDALVKGEEYVRENVSSSLAIAFVGGLLLGFALARREEPSLSRRYLREPSNSARDAVMALLAPVAQTIREQYSGARGAAADAADHLREFDGEPALREAGRWGRKLKFW